jgi:hypothetical protein
MNWDSRCLWERHGNPSSAARWPTVDKTPRPISVCTLANGGQDAPADQRLHGSLAAMTASILHGAHMVRVHDVKAAVEAAKIADEIVLSASRT